MRPTLTLKKRPAVTNYSSEPVEIENESVVQNSKSIEDVKTANNIAQLTTATANASPVNSKESKNKAKPEKLTPKQIKAKENSLRNSELKAQKDVWEQKLKPLIEEYVKNLPIICDAVLMDGIEYFRPLALGIHKTILSKLREVYDTEGCSNTLIFQLLEPVLKEHVATSKYLQGVLIFTNRFDLDGNNSGEISEKHKVKAKKALQKRDQQQVNNTNKTD